MEAVVAFVNAENWAATRAVLEARQEVLFGPEAEAAFEAFIAQARDQGQERAVEMLEAHLTLLRACKVEGIEAAFARVATQQPPSGQAGGWTG